MSEEQKGKEPEQNKELEQKEVNEVSGGGPNRQQCTCCKCGGSGKAADGSPCRACDGKGYYTVGYDCYW